jgi:hypothetical protein
MKKSTVFTGNYCECKGCRQSKAKVPLLRQYWIDENKYSNGKPKGEHDNEHSYRSEPIG